MGRNRANFPVMYEPQIVHIVFLSTVTKNKNKKTLVQHVFVACPLGKRYFYRPPLDLVLEDEGLFDSIQNTSITFPLDEYCDISGEERCFERPLLKDIMTNALCIDIFFILMVHNEIKILL